MDLVVVIKNQEDDDDENIEGEEIMIFVYSPFAIHTNQQQKLCACVR